MKKQFLALGVLFTILSFSLVNCTIASTDTYYSNSIQKDSLNNQKIDNYKTDISYLK